MYVFDILRLYKNIISNSARCCDEGETFYCKHPESPAVKKLNIIKQSILKFIIYVLLIIYN